MKIFATVGTQLPFNRLIRELDSWAGRNPEVEVFAQIGRSSYKPRHIDWEKMIPAARFEQLIEECDTIVAHAGMGTIISGVEYGKRVIVMPRREEYGEHRNNHQLATADRMSRIFDLEVVHTQDELFGALDLATDASDLAPLDLCASPQLISEIRQFAGLEAR
jgi:UDP-N-acetylglucosamine transferase subunit ALG13